ncbi:MAG TPA: DUF6174 domain-containing protein [Roseiflexaceae bacterium]|nr:DUF6174 domain-containing protein [Roseiflexaceae bacterium]
MEQRSDSRRLGWLGAGALALLALLCAAALWLGPAGVAPQLALARASWEARGVRHYRMTARWTYGTIVNGPWTIEVRDERVVGGFHTRTGAPLTRGELLLAERNLRIAALFDALASELRPSAANSPRTLLARSLARVSPTARNLIDRCAARLPSVDYHPALGYPTGVTVHGSPCYRASEWTVLVLDLTLLP